jgi:hypothetical protein
MGKPHASSVIRYAPFQNSDFDGTPFEILYTLQPSPTLNPTPNPFCQENFSSTKFSKFTKCELLPFKCFTTSATDRWGFNKNKQCTWSDIPLMMRDGQPSSSNNFAKTLNNNNSMSGEIIDCFSLVVQIVCIQFLDAECDILFQIL